MLLFIKQINKIQWKGLSSTKHLCKANEHTCMLRLAINLIILKKNNQKLAKEARLMRTKINTHQNDFISLIHDLWSKTRLGMQHIHLELL
jgi:hypothetical protein